MKNIKINLDRPQVDAKSIQARKDFDGLMKNHAIMSKPFYKSTWFMGTTGLASIGLVVGGIAIFSDNDTANLDKQMVTNIEAPPEMTVPDNQIIQMDPKSSTEDLVKETFAYADFINNSNNLDGNNSTLENENNSGQTIENDQNDRIEADLNTTELAHNDIHQGTNEIMNLHPRISGKVNGSISKEELFDNKGITTESDVNVIHFELHLIDGLGGKVFEEESNQLNEEMKAALKKINSGETIYFENIKGKNDKGDIVRLNPLRYVLMN
ncbi:MAG: hypothetical protein R2780_04880 [Crocinitomicaceae bacterium]|nr:hypothetical protein [Crocinitomicaceae bacterium]